MKMKCIVVCMMLVGLACSKNDTSVLETAQSLCGSDLGWLKEIISKAEEDKATKKYKGNYLGTIYLTDYNQQPAFLINMMMGSGGIAYYAFDCSGTRFYPPPPGNGNRDELSYKATTEGRIVYSNMP